MSQCKEALLIAEQFRRAFEGDTWHGPSLLELLEGVDAVSAAARPLDDVHTIWELVSHIEVWDAATLRRLAGEACQPEGDANFPLMPQPSEAAWHKTVEQTKRTHETLVETVAALPESKLRETVPGKKYDFQFMLPGVVQHELYHAGQIAILKKAVEATRKP